MSLHIKDSNVAKHLLFVLSLLGLILVFFPTERLTVASLCVCLVFLLLYGFSYLLTRDLSAPQIVLCVAWFMSLFLTSLDVKYASHISQFNERLSFELWALLLMAISSFYVASLFAMYPLSRRTDVPLAEIHDCNTLDKIVSVSFLIAFSVYCYAVLKNGGVPAFSLKVNEDRSTFIPPSLGVFLVLFQLVPVITIIKVISHGAAASKKQICLSLVALVCILLTTQRVAAIEMILMSIITFVFLWPYADQTFKERAGRKLIVSLGIGFLAFVWVFVLIGQIRALDFLKLTDIENFALEQFYIYFGAPAPRNLQMAMDGGIYAGINEHKYGSLFFRPILWFIGFRNEVSIDDTFRGPNNATAFFNYYLDLGLFGLFLIPALIGGVCGYIYGLYRRTLSLNVAVVYAVLASCIYFLPLTERFSEPSTLIKLVMFSLVIFVVQRTQIYFFSNKATSEV